MAGIKFEPVDSSDPVFATKHELRRSAEGRKYLVEHGVSMEGYKRGQGNYSSVPFTERRFVSWDGEGAKVPAGPTCETCGHLSCVLMRFYEGNPDESHYVLFGNSDGNYVHGPSLSTEECLTLITDTAHIDAIHFGFAFGYDVNMILKDLSRNHLRILKDKGSVLWKRWRIEYLPKKWFLATDRVAQRTVRIWDVWTFFMSSAVKAWDEYNIPVSTAVIDGKNARGSQSYLDVFPEVFRYWKEENDAYVELVSRLRESLHSAKLFISAWHGPGAIASYSMQKHHIAQAMDRNIPHEIGEAAQYAYGGGRFELFKIGRINQPVYEYDINSAYPYAISQLPNLVRGKWRHVDTPNRVEKFGVYRITWAVNPFEENNFHRPMPFFHRDKHGQISFPCVNETWVWSPELSGKLNFPGLTIHEGWEFIEDDPTDRPFAWLAENYHIRKLYQVSGNQAQHALKLQMNSMYGKMAQRVGWNEEKRTAPKWHQLEWAGWVTSYCRAMVFRASLYSGDGLISFETDAVFTTKRIAGNLNIGDGLGNWKETTYDDFVYLQSGCRFGLKNGEWKEKYRGFDRGSITLDATLEALSNPNPDEWKVYGKTSRFIGFAQALHTTFAHWRQFQTDKDRVMKIGGEGKRKHIPKLCASCRMNVPASEMAHDCALGSPIGGPSVKHSLPWKDPELLLTQELADEYKYDDWELV